MVLSGHINCSTYVDCRSRSAAKHGPARTSLAVETTITCRHHADVTQDLAIGTSDSFIDRVQRRRSARRGRSGDSIESRRLQ